MDGSTLHFKQVPVECQAHRRLALAADVARRFYVDDKSKMEIAAECGISRFQVARLLDLARSSGVVSITINI